MSEKAVLAKKRKLLEYQAERELTELEKDDLLVCEMVIPNGLYQSQPEPLSNLGWIASKALGERVKDQGFLGDKDPGSLALRSEREPTTFYSCAHLQANGDCGIYETRPKMCHTYPKNAQEARCEFIHCTDDKLKSPERPLQIIPAEVLTRPGWRRRQTPAQYMKIAAEEREISREIHTISDNLGEGKSLARRRPRHMVTLERPAEDLEQLELPWSEEDRAACVQASDAYHDAMLEETFLGVPAGRPLRSTNLARAVRALRVIK